MNILDIISKKTQGKELTKNEIEYFIKKYTEGKIPDYQASALIMAIYLKGMTEKEIQHTTIAMTFSGNVLDLSEIDDEIFDKHSTGGVGDKVTLILCPLIASLGIKVAKMSGRGLGFTGGTIDKLESIPGMETEISIEEFVSNVNKIGLCIMAQTEDIAAADKKIYALRDTISCVESIPLITSSVLSKKFASGANKIVIDITIGSGALIKNVEDGIKLAEIMIKTAKILNKEIVCILTNMDEPLGKSVGNNLEVIEAVEFLKGNMDSELKTVVFTIACNMLKMKKEYKEVSEEKIEKLLMKNIENGKAYQKLIDMIENQNGDSSYLKDIKKFEKSKYIIPVYSIESGYIHKINAEEIGSVSGYLGAGRLKKDDIIDNSVGIVMKHKVADKIKKGEILAYIHANQEEKVEKAKLRIINAIQIRKEPIGKSQTIIKIVK